MSTQTCARVLLVVCVAVTVLNTVNTTTEMAGPPDRPKVFNNPNELKSYLKALNEYFAIVGRPRFGKRTQSEDYMDTAKRPDFLKFDMDGNGDEESTGRDYMHYLLTGYRK